MEELEKILKNKWLGVHKCPSDISFRCLIKFNEFGLSGVGHISTGYWRHLSKSFTIDNVEMESMSPEFFIPQGVILED